MFDYKRIEMMIKERTAKIAIWGCGFVGTTNLFYLTKQGFNCVGIDKDKNKVEELKRGIYNIGSDEETIGRISEKEKNLFEITDNCFSDSVRECNIHMLCLPTEKNFKPTKEYIEDVIQKIATLKVNNVLKTYT